MSKKIAVISDARQTETFVCIRQNGFNIVNPETGEITGWDAEGDRKVFATEEEAFEALRLGTGIQFWRTAVDDLFIAHDRKTQTIRLYFDGWTDQETLCMEGTLTGAGINFEIDYDY